MDARGLEAKERVSASKKLGLERAEELASKAKRVIVSRGRSVQEFKGKEIKESVPRMLGSTGNLRAPTLVLSNGLVLVGYNDEVWTRELG